jgi:pyrimidine-nucleoside phosphorylase
MNTVALIQKKRDGGTLTTEEIHWLIAAYTAGTVEPYQMSSLAMAIFFRGMAPDELSAWTDAMLHSGDVLRLDRGPKIDKHSTGGVGDKVSIPLAPMVAAAGVRIPMMSGRGLGHTGGTLDKLESIPGLTTQFDASEFTKLFDEHGLVLAGQSDRLVPADKKLYGLRDASGTVESIPLIASSIMSKKLAEDLDGLVLDVKVGDGAFMERIEDARTLATTMVGLGRSHNVPVVALLTAMNQPLGREVGNASEIAESIAVLRGEGPDDLTDTTLRLGVEMLLLAGITDDPNDARSILQRTVTDGSALEKFAEVIEAQHGDPNVVESPDLLPHASNRTFIPAPMDGIVTVCRARTVGIAAMRLGAGRERQKDTIDPAVGITVLAKAGDPVAAGQPLAEIAWNDRDRLEGATSVLENAWEIGDAAPTATPSVLEVIR